MSKDHLVWDESQEDAERQHLEVDYPHNRAQVEGQQIAKIKEDLISQEHGRESHKGGGDRQRRGKDKGLSSSANTLGVGSGAVSSTASSRPYKAAHSSGSQLSAGRSSSQAKTRSPRSSRPSSKASTAAGKLVMTGHRPVSPLTMAENDVAESNYAIPNAIASFAAPEAKHRHSCPDLNALPSTAPRQSVFLHRAGNMYSTKTCSVVAGTRASVSGGAGSTSRRFFKKRSTTTKLDPFDAECENTNLLDWFEEQEKAWQEESSATAAKTWSWGAISRGDQSGIDVLDLLQEENDDSVNDNRNLDPEYEDDLEQWQQFFRWQWQEEKLDRQALRRQAGEERRLMLAFREQVSDSLAQKAGSPLKAFKFLDHNSSGQISMNEFEVGMRTLGVRWEEMTGFETVWELFRLFDQPLPKDPTKDDDDWKLKPKGYLTFSDLFPMDGKTEVDPMRMSTPDFFRYWCSRNKDVNPAQTRKARWATEETAAAVLRNEKHKERTEERKNWMRGMIHRLKRNGKSDAFCRELVALHLPKGSGPKNLEDVQTFSKNEVFACKKIYAEQVQESVRNTELRVSEMHDCRTKLRHAKQQLYHATEEPLERAKKLEDTRASLMKVGLGGGQLFKHHHEDDDMP